jgi:hypothetical protein
MFIVPAEHVTKFPAKKEEKRLRTNPPGKNSSQIPARLFIYFRRASQHAGPK